MLRLESAGCSWSGVERNVSWPPWVIVKSPPSVLGRDQLNVVLLPSGSLAEYKAAKDWEFRLRYGLVGH